MRTFLVVAAVVVGSPVLFLLGRYGTLSVCGMFRQDFVRVAAADRETDELYAAGVRMFTAQLAPGDCLRRLIHLHRYGLPPPLYD